MFVRAVWRLRRLAIAPRSLRDIHLPPDRVGDGLGLARPDFANMTRGLFER